jgi:polyisoprenoid-binding protein YceI
MKTRAMFPLLALSFLAACADAPPPVAAATATAASAPVSGTFAITAQNSKIEWTGAKTSAHHDGSFASFQGKIDLQGAVELGKVSLDIDTSSLTIAADPALGPMVDKLAGHLKSPDFFDVAKFPKATFESTGIKVGGDNGAGYTVAGTLTLHGVSKPVSFPANITASAAKVDATATFTINRKDFGLAYPGKPDDLIKDDVQVRLTIHADKG